MMNVAIDGRGQVMRILHRDLDLRAFFDEADRVLARLVPFDGSCWLSTDPATHLPTPDLGAVTVGAAADLTRADLPTLVVWGAGDPYVPVHFAEVQPRFFRQAKIVVLPGSGHWPLVDDPAAVIDAVIPFLRGDAARPVARGADR